MWDNCSRSKLLHLRKSDKNGGNCLNWRSGKNIIMDLVPLNVRCSNEHEESDCRTFDGSLTSQSLSLSATERRGGGRIAIPLRCI